MPRGSNEPVAPRKIKMPYKPAGEMMAIVREFHGGSRLTALCEDGHNRMIRIRGRLKKKMWVRLYDYIIIKKWVIQSDQKADLMHRYIKTEVEQLRRKGLIPEILDVKL